MSEAIRFLTSLAQALAKMSLYADGHPTRAKAADASLAQLRELQKVDATPRFSFLGPAVVYGDRVRRWRAARSRLLSDPAVAHALSSSMVDVLL